MRLLRSLLSYSVFAACCAAALLLQTFFLQGTAVDWYRIAFIFGCTLAAYNSYWLLRLFSVQRNTGGYFLCIATGIGIAVVALTQSPLPWKVLVRLSLISTLYFFQAFDSAGFAKREKFKYYKSMLLALVWTIATIDLTGAVVDDAAYIVLFLHRLSFMLLLCITFDYRDVLNVPMSKNEFGQYPPPQTLSGKMSNGIKIFAGLSIAGALITAAVLNFNFGLANHGIWLGLTSIVAFFTFLSSIQEKKSYNFYYLWVDGLMLLSAAGTFLIVISQHG